MSIVFHQGSLLGGALPFINGQPELVALATVSRGGIRWFNFTADEDLIQGTATIFVESPCDEDSLSIQGTYHIGEGDQPLLTESFSVKPNTPNNWLRDDRCQAISTSEGTKPAAEPNGFPIFQELGIATSSVNPGQPAPAGTFLEIMAFDQNGIFIDATTCPITGQHDPFFPGRSFEDLNEKTTMIFCLQSNDANYNLDFSAVGVNQTASSFQFNSRPLVFEDGFESGDISIWSNTVP